MPTTVTLSLISHTNVGKTTLARTLLRRDVGEVRDQAHVTEVSEAYTLIEDGDASLRLWDTPGFGDSARLMKLLRRQREPLGWFLHAVWDRIVDRPLWCSQRAVRNVQEEADVVLYLVNAAEEPGEAGYLGLELELLGWIGRPTVVLLNQVGPNGASSEQRWREFAEDWPTVRDVLPLDAFTRCWVEEGVLLQRVVPLLEGEKRTALIRLTEAWNRRNLEVFSRCVDALAEYLTEVALDRESPGKADRANGEGTFGLLKNALRFRALDKRRAMDALNRRLDRATAHLMERMIRAHELEGDSAAKIERRVRDYQVRGAGVPLDERSGALAGAVVSGALSGLAADALSGGLSLGGGMIAGGILGALGGAALGRGYRLVGGDEQASVRFTGEFLDRLLGQALLRYLSVAHFGRGRGSYRDIELPGHWSPAVENALADRRPAVQRLWRHAESDAPDAASHLRAELATVTDRVLRDVLRGFSRHADWIDSPPV